MVVFECVSNSGSLASHFFYLGGLYNLNMRELQMTETELRHAAM